MNKKKLASAARARRGSASREQRATRLVVSRSNQHIYAQIIAPEGDRCSRARRRSKADVRKDLKNGGNSRSGAVVGKRIAERAKALGIETVAFDRSGYRFHGRVKALAEAAREGGLKF